MTGFAMETISKVAEVKTGFYEIGKKPFEIQDLREDSERYGISGNKIERASFLAEIQEERQVHYELFPRNGGEWSGEIGNSTWKPTLNEIPKQPPGNNETWGEILKTHRIEGIDFKEGEPDFTRSAKATTEISDFSENRNTNFIQADEKLAEQWTIENKEGKEWSAQDVREYRKENNLTWHERSDMKTLDLVPQEIHGNVPHSGGISACKNKIRGVA